MFSFSLPNSNPWLKNSKIFFFTNNSKTSLFTKNSNDFFFVKKDVFEFFVKKNIFEFFGRTGHIPASLAGIWFAGFRFTHMVIFSYESNAEKYVQKK
jgi:hypothetical protein